MRIVSAVLPVLLLSLASPARADSVKGWCERDGKRLAFTDGIAFQDARDAQGVVTTTIYLTAEPLDRGALAKCSACAAAPGESTFTSPRGDAVEAQRGATAAGWMEIAHTGGELDMATIVNLMYVATDGTLTGLDGGISGGTFLAFVPNPEAIFDDGFEPGEAAPQRAEPRRHEAP